MIRLLSIFFASFALVFSISSVRAQTYTWAPAGLQGDSVTSIAIAPNGDIFAAVATYWINETSLPYIGVFRSDDNGNTWTMLNNPKNDQGGTISLGPVYGFVRNGDLFMGDVTGGGKGLARSDDTGGNISQLYMTMAGSDPAITSITFSQSGEIDVATGISGLLVSDDNGMNWTSQVSVSFPNSDDYPATLACSPQGVLYAASATQLSRKNTPSSSWQPIGGSFSGFGNAISFAFDKDGNLVAGGNSGLFRSTNNGSDWSQLSSPAPSNSSYALAIGANGDIFMSPQDFEYNESGVYLSTNNGSDWNEMDNGLTNTAVNAFAINRAGVVFAATYSGVFKTTTSTGGVKEVTSDIPSSFLLEQNHPNPVASSTTIRFAIPEPELVSLKVFDETGNLQSVLANKSYPAGTYDVDFDASTLRSGMYFYRIEAGGFTQTKSFVVMP